MVATPLLAVLVLVDVIIEAAGAFRIATPEDLAEAEPVFRRSGRVSSSGKVDQMLDLISSAASPPGEERGRRNRDVLRGVVSGVEVEAGQCLIN